ncbi:MAG TPA: hypothetical protein V6D14_17585 [Coleofasciculaceae cyanobacterium]|jgi:hypothetical protein
MQQGIAGSPEKPCNALLFCTRIMNILSKNASLRALSVAGAFPWLLASGKKPIELRSWGERKHRNITLLHSSSSSYYEASFVQHRVSRQQCPKFAFIGAATLVDVVCYDSRQKWERDIDKHLWDEDYDVVLGFYGDRPPYGHVFDNPVLFDEPILDVPGAYGYWQPKNDRQKKGFEQAMKLLVAITR